MIEFRSNLAVSHHNLGRLLSRTGKPAEAEAGYRAALAIFQKLADDNPAVMYFRSSLAFSHNSLGTLLNDSGKPAEAVAEYCRGRRCSRSLSTTTPLCPNSAASWRSATTISVSC